MGPWPREDLKCVRCRSSARQRAIIDYIRRTLGDLSGLGVYEPSPTPPASGYLERFSATYTWSVYSPGRHSRRGGQVTNQNLESLTFDDDSFDLVVSQDVFEHVARPRLGFAEVSRVLKPGGSHIFTIPWYPDRLTEHPAELTENGVVHHAPPEYHSDPYNAEGSLVFSRFGSDISDLIRQSGGMETRIIEASAPHKGICGDSLFVLHSKKPACRQ